MSDLRQLPWRMGENGKLNLLLQRAGRRVMINTLMALVDHRVTVNVLMQLIQKSVINMLMQRSVLLVVTKFLKLLQFLINLLLGLDAILSARDV